MSSNITAPIFSLVIPVYRNAETITPLLAAVEALFHQLDRRMEAVFVVDGSPDESYEMLRDALPGCAFPAELIRLSRNFGSFAAIRMGLGAARGPHFAVMAADLQEPPELIVDFFRTLQAGNHDVVYGQRRERADPGSSKLASGLFWKVYRALIQPDMPEGGMDVFACNRAVRDALLSLEEANSTLVGLLVWMGFRRKAVPFDRRPRAGGTSGWTFGRKLRYMFDSMYAFSDLPITLLLASGLAGMILSTTVGLLVLVLRLTGIVTEPGYTPIILAILFSTFLLLSGLGIVGGYVWRSFENTKRRPLYLPMTRDRFEPSESP